MPEGLQSIQVGLEEVQDDVGSRKRRGEGVVTAKLKSLNSCRCFLPLCKISYMAQDGVLYGGFWGVRGGTRVVENWV